MLRDDHVALNLACLGYGMLHTSALAYPSTEIANMALIHLEALPSQIMTLCRLIPEAVVKELTTKYPAARRQCPPVVMDGRPSVKSRLEAGAAGAKGLDITPRFGPISTYRFARDETNVA